MTSTTSNERRQEQQDAFLAAFAKTGIISRAAEESGVIFTQHHRWVKDDAAYAARFADLKRQTAVLAAETRKPPGPALGTRQTGPRAERQRANQERFLTELAKSGIVADACKETGIPQATHNYWTRHYPEYASAAEAVLAETAETRKATLASRVGEGSRRAWDDPGRREAWSEYQRTGWTPEMREAAGRRNLDRMADPAYKDRWLARSRKSREFAACGEPSYFDEIDTPDKAYWLGFITTDGMVTGFKSGSLRLVIKLARKDRAHLEILHRALQAKRPIRDTEEWSKPPGSTERKKRPVSILDVCSPQLVNALVSHGVTARKTDTVDPWDGPAPLMRHYWRGVIDGDGTIGTYDGEVKLGLCGSRPLVEAFLEWAKGICGTTASPRQGKQGNRRYWLLALGGNQRLPKLIFVLYTDAPVALARKKAEALLILTGKLLGGSLF
jgi:hypothetical protein